MADLTIPKLNANDESYVLVEWLVEDAGWVGKGDLVAVIETSKAASDLVAEDSGYLCQAIAAGAACAPGQVAGWLAATPGEARERANAAPADPSPPGPTPGEQAAVAGPVISRPARELMERHGIAESAVAALGKPFIKKEDVLALAAPPAAPALTAHQRAVARLVSESHATIPAAFTVIKVGVTHLIEQQAALGAQGRRAAGLPEVTVAAVAGLHAQFPHCFARVGEGLSLEESRQADIGVTIDVGTGLFVPVIRDAAALGLAGIATALMDFRMRALRRTLREEDLAGGGLTLTLHSERGIVLAQPIVFPGQCCALSLCPPAEELALAGDGTVARRHYLHLGLAYDHRVLNGREAAAFLAAIKGALEKAQIA